MIGMLTLTYEPSPGVLRLRDITPPHTTHSPGNISILAIVVSFDVFINYLAFFFEEMSLIFNFFLVVLREFHNVKF